MCVCVFLLLFRGDLILVFFDWQAWARAGQDLISRAFPSAQHIVVNTADRHMPLTAPDAVVEQVLKLVRRWRLKQPAAARK